MAKIPVKDWSGGINDKFSGNRISENQSKDSTDVELTNFRLSSSKGVDTTQTASGDYKFRGKWETDANAEKFLEYGDTLAKTYEANKVPAFVRKRGDTGNLTAEQSIGVPDKPSNAPTATIQTAGQTGSQPAVASFTVETEFGNSSSVADAGTGGLSDIGSDLNAPNQFYNTANDRLVTFDGTSLKVYDVSSNQLAQLPTSSPATHTPTYKDKWWFQDGYWVGVNATGISVLKFAGSGDPTLTQATHGTQTFTSAVFSESTVQNSSTSSAWKDGWIDSSNVTSGMSSLYPTDTYSVTSSSNKVFVSRVRKGKWWTINGARRSDGTMQLGMSNGYSSDSQGFARFHFIIRDQGSTITLDDRTENALGYSWYGVDYYNRYPRLASINKNGLTFELYDFHSPSGSSYSGWPHMGVLSTSSNRFSGYWTDTYTSTSNRIVGPFNTGVSDFYTGFGASANWKCTGNTLICIPIHDRISGNNFVDSYTLSDNGSTISVKRSISGGGTDHIVYWNLSDGNFSIIATGDVGWSGEDQTTSLNTARSGPGYYYGYSDGSGSNLYNWSTNVGDVAISANNAELIHQFGTVWPIESTELTSYTLDGVTKTTSYHNNDATIEPTYYVGSNTARLWNWRQNNRSLYLDTHVKGGLSTNYLSHLLKNTHSGSSNTTTGFINVTPEGSVTKSNYDSGTETYHSNTQTDIALNTASSGYQTTNKIAFFNGVLGYIFVSLNSSVGWGSGNYKYKTAGSNFDVSSGWTTKNLGHSHSETRTSGTSILFFNPNLDVLVPASGSLTNKSSYNISSNVVQVNLLDSNKIVYRASNENVMKVVNTGASNANTVYALPFSDVIKYSSEFFYGIEYDYGSDARWENYRKCYVFYESEFSGSAIKNVTTGSGDTGSITNVYSDSQNTTNRKKYILFSVTSAYNWRSQNLYIHISSTRIPKIVATEQQVYTDADCVATTVSSRVITLDNQAQALTTQVGDKFVLKKAGVEKYTGYVNSKSTSTTKQITLTTDDTIDGSVSDGNACTFTASRYVSKNRVWFDNSDYSKITVVTDEDFATQYSSTTERVAFDELASTDFLAVVKSSQSINVAGTHFYSDFDKHADDSSALNLGSSTFTIGASDLNVTGGTPYSYIISYLRDIAESNENDADGNPVELLIEGPSTDESNEITINSASNHISVAGFGSSVPSGVTKIRVYRSGGNFTTYQHIVDLDVSGGIPAKYDDISKNILSTGFTPLPDRAKPKSDFRYIANVSGIFFSSQDSRLRFSEFGTYHSWPELAYIDMQGTITGIIEYAGEGLVFTEDALYRVRGFDPFEMTSIQVPDVQGLPLNNRKTLTRWGSSVIWLSQDGVCLYSNGQVSVVTLGTITPETFNMTEPSGEVIDNIYYLMQLPASGVERKGFSVDFRKGLPPAVSRVSQDAERLIKVSSENRLYIKNGVNTSNAGAVAEGSTQALSFTSREYDLGDLNEEKVIKRMQIVYSGSGTVKLFREDGTTEIGSKALSSSTNRTTAFIYPTVASIEANNNFGRFFHYTVTGNCVVHEAYLEINPMSEYQNKLLFNFADITYTGTPVLSFYIDGVYASTSPALSAVSSGIRTTRVWFENAVVGHVPCYYDSSASGEIHNISFGTEDA